jgi:hypothetical protein
VLKPVLICCINSAVRGFMAEMARRSAAKVRASWEAARELGVAGRTAAAAAAATTSTGKMLAFSWCADATRVDSVGMVHVWVGQKLLKHNILRVLRCPFL